MADSNDIVYTLRVQADSQSGTQQMGADVKNATEQAQQAVNQLNGTLQAQNEWFKQTTQSVNANSESAKAHAANIASLNAQYETLMGKLDPVVGATNLYNQRLQLLDDALKANVITTGQHADATAKVAAALDAVEAKAAKAAAGVVETDVAAKAATSTLNALGMTTNMTIREFRAMFDELASGRYKQFDGTLANVVLHAAQANPEFIAMGVALGVAATAVGVLTAAYIAGSAEQQKFNEALVLTGSYSGQTTDSLRQLADQIAESGGRIGTAKDAVLALANSGKITTDNFALIAQAATQMSDVTGESVDKIVAQFVKLGDSPVQASVALNNQTHYLTEAIFEQIDALAKHGDKVAAANLAEQAYADALRSRAAELQGQLGYVQRAWNWVKDAASEAWNAMLNIGKPQTLQQQLADVNSQLEAYKNGTATDGVLMPGGSEDELKEKAQNLQHKLAAQEATASQKAYNDTLQQEGIIAEQAVRAQEEHARGLDRVNTALDTFHKQIDNLRQTNPNSDLLDPSKIKAVEDQIKRGGPRAPRADHQGEKDQNADQNLALQQYKDQLAQENDANKDSTTLLQSEYKAKLISEQDYYTQSANLVGQHLDDILTADAGERKVWEEALSRATTKQAADKAQQQLDKLATTDKIAIADATAKEIELLNTHTAAVNHDRDAIQGYVDTLQKENDSRQKTIDNQITALGMGSREAALYQQLEAIHAEYYQKLEALDLQHQKDGTAGDSKYTADKNALQSATEQAVQITKNGYDRMTEAQQDWSAGVKKGFEDFQDQANDAAKQSTQAFSDFSSGMTNAIVEFATTGKLSFSSMASSVIKDIIRMEVEAAESKVFGMIASLVGSAFGSAGGSFSGGDFSGAFADTTTGYSGGGNAYGFSVSHSGSIAGGESPAYRDADMSLFTGAPRFHTGGIVDGEVPIIAQAGEAVMPTVRLSNGQLGVQMAGDGSGGGANVTVPVSMTVSYQAGQGGGQGSGNDQNNINDFSNKLAQQLQSAVDQRISQWAANATRPGGPLSGTQANRFGGG